MISGSTGSARTSSIRRATCGCWRSSRRRRPIPRSSRRWSHFARSRPWQRRRHREGHAEFHRQSHRPVWRRRKRWMRWQAGKYTIEEIDAITGPALGRPKSAHVPDAGYRRHRRARPRDAQPARAPDDEADREAFAVPPIVDALIESRRSAKRSARAFTSGARAPTGETEIWTLDPATLEYRPKQSARIASIEAGKSIDDLAERVRMLFKGKDKAGEFLRETLAPTLVYTARVTPQIAESIDDVDRAMRWGFGWELGPFELIDVIGVKDVLAAAQAPHADASGVPPLMAEPARSRRASFPRRPREAGRGGPADPADGEGAESRHQEECRRQPGRSRRRRACRRVPLEDERDRRRHDSDAARRGEGGGARADRRS